MPGWIKLHRVLTEKAIWTCSTPAHCKILITLLTMANHEEKQWLWQGKKFEAKPGQFVTSLDSIRKKCGKGISTQNVRSALVKFKELEFLTYESTKTGRLITIVNWLAYQAKEESSNKDSNCQPTNDQQSNNKEPTTNKNVRTKECKNDKENIYTPQFEAFWNEYPEGANKKDKPTAFKNFKNLLKKVEFEIILQCTKNYATDCSISNNDFIFAPKNFVGRNAEYKNYLAGEWIPVKPQGGKNNGTDKQPDTKVSSTGKYQTEDYGNFFK